MKEKSVAEPEEGARSGKASNGLCSIPVSAPPPPGHGWIVVGIEPDTIWLVIESLRHWWHEMGQRSYPRAKELLVVVPLDRDGARPWAAGLQGLANQLRLAVTSCYVPPATSRWKKVAQRLVLQICQSWSAERRENRAVVLEVIGPSRKTRQEPTSQRETPSAKRPEEGHEPPRITPAAFRGDWNYTVRPQLL